jgi:hypothetical protein
MVTTISTTAVNDIMVVLSNDNATGKVGISPLDNADVQLFEFVVSAMLII